MPRSLSAATIGQLRAKIIRPFCLFEGDWEDGTVYLTNHYREIVFNGHAYGALGQFLSFEAVEENLNLETTGTNISFSAIPEEIRALVIEQNFINRPVRIYLGFVDGNDVIVDSPVTMFQGYMDGMTLTDDLNSGNATIVIPAVSEFADFDKISGRKSNPTEQKRRFPGDTIFDDVPLLADKIIYWG